MEESARHLRNATTDGRVTLKVYCIYVDSTFDGNVIGVVKRRLVLKDLDHPPSEEEYRKH